MKWKHPSVTKIYEAIGAVADGRVEVSGDTAKIYSSSGNKYYDVSYDSISSSIMSNDNSSYWQSYLGYPAIAYLLKIGVLKYESHLGDLLKGIAWKDINQKFKNDFDKALKHILGSLNESDVKKLESYVESLNTNIISLDLSVLGSKIKPPEGY